MSKSSQHPPQQQLVDFGLGKLEPDQTLEIEEHLDHCAECNETLLTVTDDTFTGLVRSLPEPGQEPLATDAPASESAADTERGTEADGPSPTGGVTDGAAADEPSHAATMLVQSGAPVENSELPAELQDHPRYQIIEQIGQGGMGAVYRAQHRLMNRPVALKLINSQLIRHPQAVERFRREVQAAAQLAHPNIVAAYDAEQAGDVHFLAMEFVEGTDLADVVSRRGQLPVSEACDYIRQAAEGLQHAHEKGMVHRDIKPHNLMLSPDGQVRILDFGLAGFATESAIIEADSTGGAAGDTTPLHLTTFGSVMGTPDYIAPEQARDAHSADIRADIYSLGCTLRYLLTGQPPFAADSVVDKLKAHMEQAPPPLSEQRDDVPDELAAIVARMMAKEPDARFQTPADVAAALSAFAGGETQAVLEQPSQPTRLRPLLLLSGIVTLLAAVIYIATTKGNFEVRSEVDGVKVTVSRDGDSFRVLDANSGTSIFWLPADGFEVTVKADTAVSVSRKRVRVSWMGRQIIEVKRAAESPRNGSSGHARPPTAVASGEEQSKMKVAQAVALEWLDHFDDAGFAICWDSMANSAKANTTRGDGIKKLQTKSKNLGAAQSRVASSVEFVTANVNAQARYVVATFDTRYATAGSSVERVSIVLDPDGRWRVAGHGIAPRGADQDLLQGKWVPDSCLMRGKALAAEQLARMSITLAGNRAELTAPENGQRQTGKFEIDASRSPKHIDFISPDGKERMPGIFEFDGERLKLAWVDGDYARPTDFESAQTQDHMTAVFKRVPGSAPPTVPHDKPAALVLDETQREVVESVEAYLAVMDEGKFGELWNMCASMAKRHATRGQVSQTYQKLRDTFGKAERRTLSRVQLYDEFPGLPKGRYAGVQYKTDCARQKRLWESALLNVDTDGKWRVNTYALTLEPMPFPDAKPDPATEQKKRAALTAAGQWLKLIDAGKYGEAWEACAEATRKADDKQTLVTVYTRLFQSVGKLKSRDILSNEYVAEPSRESAVIRYDTQFLTTRVIETVALTRINDGNWRVSGYFHEPRPSTPTPTPSWKPEYGTGPIKAGVNLVNDPSLEGTAPGQLYPKTWGNGNLIPKDAWRFEVVEGGRTGKRGWMIEGDGTAATVPSNRSPVDRAFRYAARACVKVESGMARLGLLYFDKNRRYIDGRTSSATTARVGEWHRLTMVDEFAKHPDAAYVSLALIMVGPGKVVFDDLELIPFDANNLPENFEAEYAAPVHDPALFDRWVGHWELSAEFKAADGSVRTVKGTADVRTVLDDQFLLWQSTSDTGGDEFLSLTGFDRHIGAYRNWGFDSRGVVYRRVGTWDAEAASLNFHMQPNAAGNTAVSTDQFVSVDRMESVLLDKNSEGQTVGEMRVTWIRKSETSENGIALSTGPADEPKELAVLQKLAGVWKAETTLKPSVWEPDGKTEVITERSEWVVGGRALLMRGYDEDHKQLSLSLTTWSPQEKSYRMAFFSPGTFGAQWSISWDEVSKEFRWRATDMPTGWIGTATNRWLDDDTFDNLLLIKDEQGRVLLDSHQKRTRIK